MGRKCKSGARGPSAILDGNRLGPRGALAALIGLCLAIGCATPEERYHTLSMFFDDVPVPESMRPAPVVLELEVVSPAELELSKAPTFEWVVHEPDCDECHTSKETQLAYADAPELCWDCHDQEDFVDSFLHGPFAAGACLECHTPHKSQYASLLRESPAELCGGCHDATTFAALEQHRVEEGEDCVECHSPHSSSERHLLQPDAPTDRSPDPDPESGSGARP
jgi:predicted CXXCH cytochrome family protein